MKLKLPTYSLCLFCHSRFTRVRGNQKFCCNECRTRFYDSGNNLDNKPERYHRYYQIKPTGLKACRECGKEFLTNNKKKAYCGAECQIKHRKKAYIKKSNITHACITCNKHFETHYPFKKYCSDTCRKAHNEIPRS